VKQADTAVHLGKVTLYSVLFDVSVVAQSGELCVIVRGVGGAESRESYLNIAKIIQVAKQHNVDAIHPGIKKGVGYILRK
jgi:acetyl/propionyl-CoA carboxylase alpha subunit